MTYHFDDELRRFGPEAVYSVPTSEEALAYCRRLTRSHYENFTVAGFFLPKLLHRPFHAVYAYCRWSDDLGDETGGGRRTLELLDWWEGELDACFESGEARHPVFVALREIALPYRLEKKPFADLLRAFRQDQVRKRYETFEELLAYCRCSADPVGRIVLRLAEGAWSGRPASEEQLVWSDSICTGLQLINHWQDVRRDAEIGRCYIPLETFQRYGLEPGLPPSTETAANKRFRAMIRFLVEDAEQRLRAGRPLISSVPKPLRRDIRLFIEGGLAIAALIRRMGFAVDRQRPVLSKLQKIRLLLRTFGS